MHRRNQKTPALTAGKYKFTHIPSINSSECMFNCSLVVKDSSSNYTFVFDSSNPLNRVYLSVRETPSLTTIKNSITVCEYDISNNTLNKIYPVVKHGRAGNYEDARFFFYKNQLGISYTYNMSIAASLLNDEFSISQHNILPIIDYFPPIEKNWTFFEKHGELYTIRNYCPLEVYKVNMDAEHCLTPHSKWEWKYGTVQLRGGSPPVLWNNKFFMALHSAHEYQTYMFVIDAETFQPLQISSTALLKDLKTRYQFACGLLYDTHTSEWIISMGIDDVSCGLARFSEKQLLLTDIKPVTENKSFAKYVMKKSIQYDKPPPTDMEILIEEIKHIREELSRIRVLSSMPNQ